MRAKVSFKDWGGWEKSSSSGGASFSDWTLSLFPKTLPKSSVAYQADLVSGFMSGSVFSSFPSCSTVVVVEEAGTRCELGPIEKPLTWDNTNKSSSERINWLVLDIVEFWYFDLVLMMRLNQMRKKGFARRRKGNGVRRKGELHDFRKDTHLPHSGSETCTILVSNTRSIPQLKALTEIAHSLHTSRNPESLSFSVQ
mmetsp:Transcript_18813/g.46614  ORF Transcript_18813/g.46614 Transcript_18813/m.46614 type:complete len:197 (-) Transcript_18813:648-1238(-)